MSTLVWEMVCSAFPGSEVFEFISSIIQTSSGPVAEYSIWTCGTMLAVHDVSQVRVNFRITCTDSSMD